MKHPLQKMMEDRRNGIKAGIPSYCTANPLVLETALRRAKLLGRPVLIEATANQVNQYGGYTGMVPKDFYKMVLEMAEKIGVPENQMILAGDHLGPLTWQNLPEKEAMDKSIELVYEYARWAKDKKTIPLISGDEDSYSAQAIYPICCEGDCIGAVILYSRENQTRFSETEYKAAACAASSLGKQMEG